MAQTAKLLVIVGSDRDDRMQVAGGQLSINASTDLHLLIDGREPDDVQDVLSAVRERMPLDFFGMDFGIAPDGRVVLFEANATMNFFPLSPDPRFAYLSRCVEPARSAFAELLGLPQPAL
jgi:hypothetical protein